MYNNLFFCFPCYMQQFPCPFPNEQMRSIQDFEDYNDAEDYNDETENYSNMEEDDLFYDEEDSNDTRSLDRQVNIPFPSGRWSRWENLGGV